MRALLPTLCLAIFPPALASAARLSLAGVASSSQPNAPGIEYTGKTGYGAGALLEMRFVPLFGLELGFLAIPRRFEYSSAVPTNAKFTVEGKIYEFPVLLRAHLGRVFSLGIGAYYSRATGAVSVSTEQNGSVSSQSYTYQEQNQTTADWGIATSLALTPRLAGLIYGLVDARYTIGTRNNSTVAGSDRKYNDAQLLAGLQFGF